MGQTWDDAKDLLARALELPVHAREAFVREHCRDPKVLDEVLALLHQSDSSVESHLLPSLPSPGTAAALEACAICSRATASSARPGVVEARREARRLRAKRVVRAGRVGRMTRRRRSSPSSSR